MNSSYDEALALLRGWQKSRPTLSIDFWLRGDARLNAKCVISDVSDKVVSVAFGLPAVGEGTLTLPFLNMVFNRFTPDDTPLHIRAGIVDAIVCWLEVKHPILGDGFIFTEFKPDVFVSV